MKKNFNEILAFKRKEKKLSQVDIAKKLEAFDIHVSNAAVSAWEKAVSMPTAQQFLALCEILDITDIYSDFIGENKDNAYYGLNSEGIKKAKEIIDLLKLSDMYKVAKPQITQIPRRMKVSLLAASAGTGDPLDDENFEEIDIYDPVPKCADFGVRLNGDSMQPQFDDGEIVWLKKTEIIDSGEYGVFGLNGKAYFKKFKSTETGVFLVSLNPKYDPIQIYESDSFHVFAKLAID